jgi:hypothetical protein
MKDQPPPLPGRWRPVSATLAEWAHATRKFGPLATTHRVARANEHDRGEAVWGVVDDTCPLALCWEWAELRRGVVTLVDPMSVCSNVTLVAEDGQPLSQGRTLLAFNHVVHQLNWQRQVCAELASRREGQARPGARGEARAPALAWSRGPGVSRTRSAAFA